MSNACCGVLWGCLALVCLLSSGCTATDAAEPDPRVAALFGGNDSLAAVREPERVTAWRVTGHLLPQNQRDENTLHGYKVLAGPKTVELPLAAKLAQPLLRSDSYLWDLAKGCEFQPGVAVRFERGKTTLDVLLCFGCNELEIHRDGRRVGGEDIDNIRGALVAVAKQLFPDDADIAKLQ